MAHLLYEALKREISPLYVRKFFALEEHQIENTFVSQNSEFEWNAPDLPL